MLAEMCFFFRFSYFWRRTPNKDWPVEVQLTFLTLPTIPVNCNMYHVMLAKSWTRAFCFRKQFSTTFHRNNAMDQEREEQYRVANALLDTKKKIDVLSKDYGLNYTVSIYSTL